MAPRSRRRSPPTAGDRADTARLASKVATVVVLAASMLAMGGVFPRAAALLAALVAIPLVLAGPMVGGRFRAPAMVWVFAAASIACLLQCVPLPMGLLAMLAPANADIWSRAVPGASAPSFAPLSLAPELTLVEAAKWAAYGGLSWLGAGWTRRHGASGPALVVAGLASLAGVVTVLHGALDAKSVFGIYTPLIEYPRWRVGPFLNANHLSAYLSMGVFGALAALLSRRDRGTPLAGLLVVQAGGLTLGVLLLGSRAAVPLLIVGVVAALVFSVRREVRGVPPAAIRWGLGAIGVFFCVVVFGLRHELAAFLGDRELTKLGAIRDAFTMARAHWTSGVGRGAFETAFFAFKTVHRNEYWPQPENLLAQWSSEWGWPVTVLLAFAFVGVAVAERRSVARSVSARVMAVGLFVLVIHNMLDSSLELFGVGAMAAFLFGATFGVGEARDGVVDVADVGGTAPRLAGALVVAVAVLALFQQPESPSLARARALRAANGGEAAEPLLLASVHRFPADPWYPLAMGTVKSRVTPLVGLPWYNRALERGPNVAATHLQIAIDLARAGRRRQALLEIRFAAERDDEVTAFGADLAAGLAHSAEEAITAAPTAGPSSMVFLMRLAGSVHPWAPEVGKVLLERDPCLAPLRQRAVETSVAGWAPGKDAEVEAQLRLMEGCPDGKPIADAARADLLWAQGKRKESVALLDGLCGTLSTDAAQPCLVKLAERAAQSHDEGRLRKTLRAAISRRCGDATECGVAWAWAASLYLSAGDEPSAQAAATKATEVDPSELSHWRLLASISMSLGVRERAISAAKHVLARVPDDAVSLGILESARALPPRVIPRRP